MHGCGETEHIVMNQRSWKLAWAAICLVAVTLSAQRGARTPIFLEPELKIAVNATTIESFPIFAAADLLAELDNNPRIQLVPTPNGRAAMAQLVSGAVDAATGSETQALLNSVADPRVRIVITLSECRYRIIARGSAGIQRVSDLRGKKVAATINTSSQYYLAGMLRAANLREADIQMVPLEGPEMARALQTGAVDAVSILGTSCAEFTGGSWQRCRGIRKSIGVHGAIQSQHANRCSG